MNRFICYQITCFLISFFLTFSLHAQKKHTQHQTISLEKGIGIIGVDLVDDWKVTHWNSNTVMIEINIELYQTNQGLSSFLLESDRYQVQTETNADTLVISSIVRDRNNLKNQQGATLTEIIRYQIYMPNIFEINESGFYVKKMED